MLSSLELEFAHLKSITFFVGCMYSNITMLQPIAKTN